MSYQQKVINNCINFMLKNLNVLLYNPKILPDNYGKSHYINYFKLRKNKELSPHSNYICEWCYGNNNPTNKPTNKLYSIYLYEKNRKYSCNETYRTGRYVICCDCMYIINQLRNTDCIHLYEKHLENYLYLGVYTIFPNKKWIININIVCFTKIVSFDVGYINNINKYITSPEYLRLNDMYNYCGKYKNISSKINQLIESNSHHYNILLKVYFLLKQVLIKDVSMVIGCFIISYIKND